MPGKADENVAIKLTALYREGASDERKSANARLQAGMICPGCNDTRLDYNGLLQLICPRCGVIETGAFT